MPSVADFFVIVSATSTTHARAISDSIIEKLKQKGERVWHVEGEREGSWVVLDYGDVVAHVFLENTRRFYNLEQLWGDAPQKRYGEPVKRRRPAARKAKKIRKTGKARKAAKKRRKKA